MSSFLQQLLQSKNLFSIILFCGLAFFPGLGPISQTGQLLLIFDIEVYIILQIILKIGLSVKKTK